MNSRQSPRAEPMAFGWRILPDYYSNPSGDKVEQPPSGPPLLDNNETDILQSFFDNPDNIDPNFLSSPNEYAPPETATMAHQMQPDHTQSWMYNGQGSYNGADVASSGMMMPQHAPAGNMASRQPYQMSAFDPQTTPTEEVYAAARLLHNNQQHRLSQQGHLDNNHMYPRHPATNARGQDHRMSQGEEMIYHGHQSTPYHNQGSGLANQAYAYQQMAPHPEVFETAQQQQQQQQHRPQQQQQDPVHLQHQPPHSQPPRRHSDQAKSQPQPGRRQSKQARHHQPPALTQVSNELSESKVEEPPPQPNASGPLRFGSDDKFGGNFQGRMKHAPDKDLTEAWLNNAPWVSQATEHIFRQRPLPNEEGAAQDHDRKRSRRHDSDSERDGQSNSGDGRGQHKRRKSKVKVAETAAAEDDDDEEDDEDENEGADYKSKNKSPGKRKKWSPSIPKTPRENLTEEQKRSNHIQSEQKRRNLIKQGFEDLTRMVPELRAGGYSKSNMLVEAAKFIRSLDEQNGALREKIQGLGTG